MKVGNQRAESVRDIGVGYGREEGTVVISLARTSRPASGAKEEADLRRMEVTAISLKSRENRV